MGHTLIDRELYLPADWTEDPARRKQAGIPEAVPFRTKPQLAILMLQRLLQAQIEISWVVADSVYGGNSGLRDWLETEIQPYVMAVACDEPVVLEIPGRGVRRLEARDVPALLSPSDWQPLSMSEGTKGPRLFDWACLPIWHKGIDDGWHSLLLRRSLDATSPLSFYLVFAPPGTPLSAKVTALGGRWRIEEDFENGKDLGLDHTLGPQLCWMVSPHHPGYAGPGIFDQHCPRHTQPSHRSAVCGAASTRSPHADVPVPTLRPRSASSAGSLVVSPSQ